jgi:hypothetical protein
MFLQKPYTYSVDWWALGIVLYECTYNKHPFHASGVSVEKAILRNPILFPNQYEVTPGRYPYVECPERTDFIKRLLVRTVHERLGCGAQGNLEIRSHAWFDSIDWHALLRKQVVPDFVPDPSQNNYDFGAALEELLYESAPLASKPVKKRKDKKEPPPSLSMLWADESMTSRKQSEHTKLEQELEYINQYFEPYVKPANPTGATLASMKMPPSQREFSRSKSKSSRSRKSLDAGQMYMEEQQAFRTGNQLVSNKRGHSSHSNSYSLTSFEVDESVPPIPDHLPFRENGSRLGSRDTRGSPSSSPMMIRMAPTTRSRETNPIQSIESREKSYAGKPKGMQEQKLPQSSRIITVTEPPPSDYTPLKVNTQLKPVDLFDYAFKELDLSFPDKPEMTPSPHSPSKKHAKGSSSKRY